MVLSQGAPLRRREGLRLPALSLFPGHSPHQETRCPAVGKRLMSPPISDTMAEAGHGADSGHCAQKLDQGAKRDLAAATFRMRVGDPLIDFAVDLADGLIQTVPLLQVQIEQKAVVLRQPLMQRVVEFLRRRLDPFAGKLGQLTRLANTLDHRLDHSSPAGAHDIADDRVELDIGFDQRLLDPVDMPRLLADQLLACPRQRTKLLNLLIRDKASLDQPTGQQVGDPGRVVHVGLAPGDILDVRGVRDNQLENALAEDPEHRHPIDAGRLHGHMRTPAFLKPHPQFHKLIRRSRKSSALPPCLAFGHDPDTGHHRVLVHIQARHLFVNDIHASSPQRWYRRHRYLSEKNPRKRAPGRYRPSAPMWVIQATRVQLTTELSRTREKPTSLPTATKNTSSASDRKASFSAGRLFTPVPTHHEELLTR